MDLDYAFGLPRASTASRAGGDAGARGNAAPKPTPCGWVGSFRTSPTGKAVPGDARARPLDRRWRTAVLVTAAGSPAVVPLSRHSFCLANRTPTIVCDEADAAPCHCCLSPIASDSFASSSIQLSAACWLQGGDQGDHPRSSDCLPTCCRQNSKDF